MKFKYIVPIGMFILIVVIMLIARNAYFSKFTPRKWETHIFMRDRMFDDFLRNYNLQNMNYEEVITVLGNEGVVPDSRIDYYVGKGYVGPRLLSIKFDEDDYVTSYEMFYD